MDNITTLEGLWEKMENTKLTIRPEDLTIKPEDKRLVGVHGWLLLFCVSLFLRAATCLYYGLNTLYLVASLRAANVDLSSVSVTRITINSMLSVVVSALFLIAAVQICRRRRSAVKWAVAAMLIMIVLYLSRLVSAGVFTSGLSSAEAKEYSEAVGLIGQFLIWSVGYTAIWWSYLAHSKRVNDTLVL